MMRLIASASLALLASSTAGLAQDAFDWSGFYAGIHGGTGSATTYLSNAIVNGVPQPVTPGNETQELQGLMGGIQLGADMQMDGLVLGIQSDVSLSGVQSEESGGDPSDTLNWLATTTGRVGYAFGNVLPYLEAGVAIASATGYAEDVPATVLHMGLVAGAGLDVALSEQVSLGVEYNYIALSNETYEFTDPSIGSVIMDARHDLHTVKGSLNFHF